MNPIQPGLGIGAGQRAQGVQGVQGPAGAGPAAGATDGPSFKDTLARALGDISGLQTEARDAVSGFLRGEPVEIHEVMAAAEEAGIALEMLIELRNKLTEAYRSVMQMQS